jgi:hypothetical protein
VGGAVARRLKARNHFFKSLPPLRHFRTPPRTLPRMATDAYIAEMRQRFCPVEMLEQDASLNQAYFRPPKALRSMHWPEEETAQLVTGLCSCGLGSWKEMRDKGLIMQDRDDDEVRIMCMLLFGRQDLSCYAGWRGTPEQLEQERGKNVKLAQDAGLLVHGVLADERFDKLI